MGTAFAWGIVGTGAIARQFAADLALLPDARLAAVCSRRHETATAFREAFRVQRVHTEFGALCADRELDAIYVATPNSTHAEHALAAIAAGKPVLVEKPLAATSAEARQIADAAKARGCFAMEAMWTRFLPAAERTKSLIAEGAVGTVRHIRAELAYLHAQDTSNRLFRPELGGGAALDLGVYPVSLALHLMGRPARVTGSRTMGGTGVDVRADLRLEFADATADLSCGFDRNGRNRFIVEGDAGVLVLDAPFLKAQRVICYSPRAYAVVRGMEDGALAKAAFRMPLPGREAYHLPFAGGGLQFEAAAVMAAVRRGDTQSAIMPLTDSIAVLETLEAVV